MRKHSRIALLLLVALTIASAGPLRADVIDKTTEILGSTVHYKVILPSNYDAAKAYPAVLGFSGGAQDARSVDGVIERNFKDEAEKRGYIVVIPAAPDGDQFFNGGERIFPEFIKLILSQYKIQDGKFHAAGPSNGGISSFHIASLFPQYFVSITAFPGYLWEETPQHIQNISKMCITMFVGELDPMGWQPKMQAQTQIFKDKGISAEYIVEKGQPHSIATLQGANAGRLFDLFDKSQHGCGK